MIHSSNIYDRYNDRIMCTMQKVHFQFRFATVSLKSHSYDHYTIYSDDTDLIDFIFINAIEKVFFFNFIRNILNKSLTSLLSELFHDNL